MQNQGLFSQPTDKDENVVYEKDSGPVQNPVFSDRPSQDWGSP